MKRLLIYMCLFWMIAFTVSAQNWTGVGNNTVSLSPIKKLYSDSSAGGKLYAIGNFLNSFQDTIFGIARYDSSDWDSLPCGIPKQNSNDINSIILFENQLVIGGYFPQLNQEVINNIAICLGNQWKALNNGLYNTVLSTGIYNNRLVALGLIGSMPEDSINIKNIATWNDSVWAGIGNISWTLGPFSEMAIYKGELYIGGFFYFEDEQTTTRNIAKYNGSYWSSVSSGIVSTNSLDIPIKKMIEYQNDLYIGGSFYSNNNVANYLLRWDGYNFYNVGGGINGEIRDMAIYNNELYVVGDFSIAGGVEVNSVNYGSIAKWDGHNWCSLETSVGGIINSIVNHQGELYIAGNFNQINGIQIKNIAKWVGGTFVEVCGNTTGIHEEASANALSIYPNPATDNLLISYKSFSMLNTTITIFNQYGLMVKRIQDYSVEGENARMIDISSFSNGMYLLNISSNDFYISSKFVITK